MLVASKGRKPQKTGRKGTLLEGPELTAIRNALAGRGFRTWTEAADSVGWDVSNLVKICRHGIPEDPRVSTVERLTKLGILALVPRKSG